MQMNYDHLDKPRDPSHAEACADSVRPHLSTHASIVAKRQKGENTCIFVKSDPAMSEGAVDRLVVALQENPSFGSLYHFTQGRKMVVYFSTPDTELA